ncbi:MAG: PSD1 and planctomycete cytochrome C domain-containing protein, partial [Bacteroidota bacterium]
MQNCYLCHGPDPSSRKADLRLDTYEGATALLKEGGGHAIVPGDARNSEVIKRITTKDEKVVMPPPESNLTLNDYEIAVLKKWINQGAEWKKHWAFIPPKSSEPAHYEGSVNAIDDFITEKLDEQGLEPVDEASKSSLIRRVSYLLTGIPPTPEELATFLADESDDAYEKMVDQYLKSAGFGERWARHWMDVVRYAETRGHEFDYEIVGAWRYRDYLIRAFNENVPYDQLVKEHLAGDLVQEVRWNPDNGLNESHIGTAFYALGEGKHSPVDIREEEADRIDNMIDVTSKTFQGLTVSCAKCHDHKFDPIPTADYYAMYGVMESSRFSPKPARLTYEQLENLAELEALKAGLEEMILSHAAELEVASADDPRTAQDYEVIGDFRGETLDGWKSDGLAFGKETTLGEPVLNSSGTRIMRFDGGKASSRRLSEGIFGALRSPNFEITSDFIGVRTRGEASIIRIVIDNFQLIQWPIYGGLEHIVDTKAWKDMVFDLSAWKGHKAYIEVMPGRYDRHIYEMAETAWVEVEYAIAYDDQWPQSVAPKYKGEMDRVAKMNELLAKGLIPKSYNGLASRYEKQSELIATLQDSTFFTGIDEGFGINSPVFDRGNHLNELETAIPRGFLSAVTDDHQFNTEGSGRLDLANAILDQKNPLTSRVMVNRIWHHVFGRGLVETVDNFGLQGKLPSHPELLDYLAIRFQNEGWSIKDMVKY